jgi:branched-subunit amino acid aminotransferase/4-amino-4-deoxychorismate lyase
MATVARINGQAHRLDEVALSALDHGFLYGNGLFETLRATNGVAFALDRHLRRLTGSAAVIGLPAPQVDWLADEVRAALADAGEADAYVRLTVSRGPGAPGPDPSTCGAPTVVIVVRPFPAAPSAWWERGLSLVTSPIRRNPFSPLTRLKSLNYLECILARQAAKAAGADDALFLDTDGYLAEATAWNLFLVESGRLLTPDAQGPILPGITRGIVLELATGETGAYEPARLRAADEAFLTNSLYGTVPLGTLDGCRVGGAVPGPVTRTLADAYENLRRAHCGM